MTKLEGTLDDEAKGIDFSSPLKLRTESGDA